MKLKINSQEYFDGLPDEDKYKLLHDTELKVKRLERIIEDLLVWRDGSDYYKYAVEDWEDYSGD